MQTYSYGKGMYSYQPEKIQIVLLKVYEDENGNFYLDSGAIRALKGLSRWHDYRNEFGGKETISDEVLIKKGASDNSTYVGSHDPDFSSEYNYDSILGLYQVTHADIMELIYLYEKSHPGIKVKIETEYINKKEITNRLAEETLKEYSEISKNPKESKWSNELYSNNKIIDKDLLNINKNIDKDLKNINKTIDTDLIDINKPPKLQEQEKIENMLNEMLADQKNQPDDNYNKDTNFTK